jgi:hypothetical protein
VPELRQECTGLATERHNTVMPNIASILKAEISRVARKEVRAEIEILKKASVAHRATIAELRRQVSALEKELRRVAKGAARPTPAADPDERSGNRYEAPIQCTQAGSTSREAWAFRCDLWTAGWRVRSDDLSLGTRQGTPTGSAT